jgi:hypothetical protein
MAKCAFSQRFGYGLCIYQCLKGLNSVLCEARLAVFSGWLFLAACYAEPKAVRRVLLQLIAALNQSPPYVMVLH